MKTITGEVEIVARRLRRMPMHPDGTYLFAGVIINGNFWCYENELTSLVGSPEIVRGRFSCSNNKLESLEGAPKEVTDDFFCHSNSRQFTEDEVRAVCKVGGMIFT